MTTTNPVLELHQRVLADLDRREAAIVEQEAEARKVLEQALARCAAERTSIDQDKAVLVQAAKLYRRLSETDGGAFPEASAAQPAPVPPQGDVSVLRDLRNQLWAEHESQSDAVPQRAAWAAMEPVEGATAPLR